jgi:hypothetical protein
MEYNAMILEQGGATSSSTQNLALQTLLQPQKYVVEKRNWQSN